MREKPSHYEPEHLLRYALSYLEKAHRSPNATSPPSHAERAQALVIALRRDIERENVRVGAELQRALTEQSKLVERATAGRVPPDKANALNRELLSRIAWLRAAVAEHNAALGTASAADLGGFFDLPLDEYPTTIARLRGGSARAESSPASVHQRKGLLSALIEDEPTIAGIQLKPTRLGLIVWGACIVIAMLTTLWCVGLISLGGTMDLQVAAGSSATEPVLVTIGNNGTRPIDVYVPLPEGGVSGSEEEAAGRIYGLRVWTREKGSSEYRLLPASVDCWRRQEPSLDESRPLTVPPRLSVAIVLDPAKLTALGIKVESIRVALVHADGRIAAQREVAFPGTR
jgi:hypothetical protein